MGLDMYLTRRAHIANYNHDSAGKGLSAKILTALGAKNPEQYDSGSINVELPAGYWRKANQIHAWFIANVQNGEDNCQETRVTTEHLQQLRDLCQQVSDNHNLAHELLPSQAGFFFGGTGYDEWYFQDIEKTIEILDRALDPENVITRYDSFYYQSSW